MKTFLHYMYILLVAAQFVFGVALIAVVTMQESKTDGLTGQIGTTVTSSFKGKAGREERLNLLTRNVAIVFFVLCAIVAVTTGRW